jgi:hypothetical protein
MINQEREKEKTTREIKEKKQDNNSSDDTPCRHTPPLATPLHPTNSFGKEDFFY